MTQELVNANDRINQHDVLIVRVNHRPNWWINIVHDYEDNVLGGRDKEYPSDKIYQLQHLEHYGFVVSPSHRHAIFVNPADYINCILKFGGEIK